MSDSGDSGQDRGQERQGRVVGGFEMFEAIATSAFATTRIGRTALADGSAKPVAIKQLQPQFLEKPDVVRKFLDEARVIARIQHPNLVPTVDFVQEDGELFIVMEYVEGVSLADILTKLGKRNQRVPLDITLKIMTGSLHGLHAAHEARDERGRALKVIHRDVAPENILVGVDGFARISNFGVAEVLERYKAKSRIGYMSPEQVKGETATAATDVFALSMVFWECLTGRRLFDAQTQAELAIKVTQQSIVAPSVHYPTLPRKYEDIVLKGLERDPASRWGSAEQMAQALEAAGKLASTGRVGKWVKGLASDQLEKRAQMVSMVELTPAGTGAHTQASGGQDEYRAVATQVLKRKRPKDDEETTNVIVPSELKREAEPAKPTPASQPVASQPAEPPPASQPAAVPAPSTPPRSRRRVPRKAPPESDLDATPPQPARAPKAKKKTPRVTVRSPSAPPPSAPKVPDDPDGTLEMAPPSFDAPPADDEITAPNFEPPARPKVSVRKSVRPAAAAAPTSQPAPISIPGPVASSEPLALDATERGTRGRTVGVMVALAVVAAIAIVFVTRSNESTGVPGTSPTAIRAVPAPAPAPTGTEAVDSEPSAAPDETVDEPPPSASSADGKQAASSTPPPKPAPVAARPAPRPQPAARPAPRPTPRPAAPKPAPVPREDKLFSRE